LPFIRYTFGLFANGPAECEVAAKVQPAFEQLEKLVWRKSAKPDIVAEFDGNVER
jgi:hypothetical protein